MADKTNPVEEKDLDQPKESGLKEADKTSENVGDDAESNDAPVRTNRPDVPVLGSLAVGAGAHQPREIDTDGLDKDGLDRDGRPAEPVE